MSYTYMIKSIEIKQNRSGLVSKNYFEKMIASALIILKKILLQGHVLDQMIAGGLVHSPLKPFELTF